METSEEKIIKTFGYSKKLIKFFLITFIFLGIILIPAGGLGIFFLLFALIGYFYLSNAFKYTITDKKIIASFGLLSKKNIYIDYKMITDTEVKQDFIQIMMNVGNLSINTAGTNKKELVLKGIDNPNEIQKIIYSFKK